MPHASTRCVSLTAFSLFLTGVHGLYLLLKQLPQFTTLSASALLSPRSMRIPWTLPHGVLWATITATYPDLFHAPSASKSAILPAATSAFALTESFTHSCTRYVCRSSHSHGAPRPLSYSRSVTECPPHSLDHVNSRDA